MRKSIVLLVVGAFLIIVAFGTASSIPLEANKDFNRLISKSRLDWSTKESEYIYVQGSEHRRLLQNFYLGASGLICVFTGLLTLPNKNSNDAQSNPMRLKENHESGEYNE